MSNINNNEIEIEEQTDDQQENSLFETEEIEIEEMSIDGICGVY